MEQTTGFPVRDASRSLAKSSQVCSIDYTRAGNGIVLDHTPKNQLGFGAVELGSVGGCNMIAL
jgi:hypothetical protein